MGRDKAGLRFGPGTLLALALRRMENLVRPIVVSAAPEQDLGPAAQAHGALVVRDAQAFGGPLPGLLHGFRTLAAASPAPEAVLVMPVDLPFFDEAWMRRALEGLAAQGGQARARACLYRYEGFTNALVGAYDLTLLPKLERLAAAPKARPLDLSQGEPTRVLEIEQLWRPADGPCPLMDTDTPEDYDRALKLAGFTQPGA